MDASYLALIHSSRVLSSTRRVLLNRMDESYDGYQPKALTAAQFAILEAVVDRLIPQPDDESKVALAPAMDEILGSGKGDGWRYAEMPSDVAAMRDGLERLKAASLEKFALAFNKLETAEQDAMLKAAQAGDTQWAGRTGKLWFEETLALATQVFMASPETLWRMGYSGIANYPDWPHVGLNTTEAWEPKAK